MSGGLLSEKCSHDMDLLNWLVGSKPRLVSSFAARTFLKPIPDAAENCRDCGRKEICRFVHGSVPEIYEAAWPAELREVLQKLEDDTCVFSARHTYPDHQTLNIQYENGVLCNFSVTQCQPATRRTIHVLGSEARLQGVVNNNEFHVFRRDRRGGEVVETYKVTPDQSGHNGGDSVLTKDFFEMLSGRHNPERPGLREGIEASLLSLAADESAASARPVALDSLRQRVYLDQPSPQTAKSHA
jgi:predicted dehydrogenase